MDSITAVEQSVLGLALTDRAHYIELADELRPDDFGVDAHRAVWTVLGELYRAGESADVTTITAVLEKRGQLVAVGGRDYLVDLTLAAGDADALATYGKMLHAEALRRRMNAIGLEYAGKALVPNNDPFQIHREMIQAVLEVEYGRGPQFKRVDEILVGYEQEIYDRFTTPVTVVGVPTGFPALDRINGGYKAGVHILGARTSIGKAQPLWSKLKIPNGWTTIGDVNLEDWVTLPNGRFSRIIGIFPQGAREIYRLTFADGRTAESTDDHLWRVFSPYWKEYRVIPTSKVSELLRTVRHKGKLSVELCTGKWGSNTKLPIPPYLLGILLGEGNLTQSTQLRFSTADPFILKSVQAQLRIGYTVRHAEAYDYRIVNMHRNSHIGVRGYKNFYVAELRKLGLSGKASDDKFLPESYKEVSREQRVELLQGLFDADGTVAPSKTVEYCTVSEGLANDIAELIRSIGGICKVSKKKSTFTYRGMKKVGKTAYVLSVRISNPRELFTLPRKLARLPEHYRYENNLRLSIKSVEYIGTHEARCIKLQSSDGLYITDNYVVTHNTAWALSSTLKMAERGVRVAIFTLEMLEKDLTNRLLAMRSGVTTYALEHGRFADGHLLTNADKDLIREALDWLKRMPIFINPHPAPTTSDIRVSLQRLIAALGVDIAIIDHIHLMSDDDISKGKRESLVQMYTNISRNLKYVAKDLKIPLLILAQLNRASTMRQDRHPQLTDLRESGSIEQDAQLVYLLHREDPYHKHDNQYSPTHLADFEVAKNQLGGMTDVLSFFYEEKIARFHELATNPLHP